jgi:uncharacterized protein (DUF362 family)/Pyruvate/2-oxoacid:ferredoxin oxidoreductase delta subunit
MSNSSTVALVYCEDYQLDDVRRAVQTGLDLLGGAGQFAHPQEKILVKPNVLVGENSARCISPHPFVFQAVLEQFQATGAQLSFGDSPGFGSPRAGARRAGLLPVAEALQVPLADFETPISQSFPEGHLIKQFSLAKGVVESDGLVSLCKMKSHALTRLTGAIKNQFGCIPGVLKAEFHSRLPNADQFSQMLVDLNLLIRPRLYIMDGIVAMQGNGPRNGTARPMHVLLFSTDPVALDATVCRMVKLDEKLVEPIVYGNRFGLGTSQNITFVGEALERFITPDFQVNRSPVRTTTDLGLFSSPLIRTYFTPRPVIQPEQCTSCGQCERTCPAEPKALTWPQGKKNPPVYNYEHCIRCYCCQELCPHEAITVYTPLLGRLLRR